MVLLMKPPPISFPQNEDSVVEPDTPRETPLEPELSPGNELPWPKLESLDPPVDPLDSLVGPPELPFNPPVLPVDPPDE